LLHQLAAPACCTSLLHQLAAPARQRASVSLLLTHKGCMKLSDFAFLLAGLCAAAGAYAAPAPSPAAATAPSTPPAKITDCP